MKAPVMIPDYLIDPLMKFMNGRCHQLFFTSRLDNPIYPID
jgi:hypothetical protein